MSQNYAGSCLCGAVRYEFSALRSAITMCHCAMCRKASGSAFGVNATVAGFRVTAGQAAISEYQSSSGKWRAFCSRCGSPIYARLETKPEQIRVRLGTLDTALPDKPQGHIYAASKAQWDEIRDALPQYPGREPGR